MVYVLCYVIAPVALVTFQSALCGFTLKEDGVAIIGMTLVYVLMFWAILSIV